MLHGRTGKFHSLGEQFGIRSLDIVDFPRRVQESTDAIFLSFRSKQDDAGLGPRNRKLNPALLLRKLLIREDAEAELLGVEQECPILVADRDAEKT